MTAPAQANRVWDFLCRHRLRLLGGFAALAALDVVWAGLVYLVYPGYVDHGEPSVALISWRLLDGVAAYPAFDDPGGVANIYGPLTYVVHALVFATLGPSVAAGKWAGVAAAILIPVGVLLSHRRRGWGDAALAAALSAALVAFHLPTTIWNRPDSLLALLVVIAVWTANAAQPGRPEWGKTIVIAVCGGAAVALKIHGGIYVAPVAVFHCLDRGRGVRSFAAMCAVGAAVAALPFASPLFSAGNYAEWLALLAGKASPPDHLLTMLRFGVVYMVPLALFLVVRARAREAAGSNGAAGVSVAETGYAAAYGVALVAAAYLGGKPGAGIHYFFPLAAITADMCLRFLPRVGWRPKVQAAALAAFAAVVLIISVPVQKRFYRALHWDRAAAIEAEIGAVVAAYPGRTIEMGVGAKAATYPRTYQKTRLVLAGHPYTVDAGVLTEWSKLGIPLSEVTLAMIRGCSTDVWLIPRGEEPFAMIGYYGNRIFGPAFRDAFLTSYAKDKSFQYLDVWTCRR